MAWALVEPAGTSTVCRAPSTSMLTCMEPAGAWGPAQADNPERRMAKSNRESRGPGLIRISPITPVVESPAGSADRADQRDLSVGDGERGDAESGGQGAQTPCESLGEDGRETFGERFGRRQRAE